MEVPQPSAATTWATGKSGSALSFTSNSSVAQVPHSDSLVMDDALTVEAWACPTQITWSHPILEKGATGTDEYGLFAAMSNTGSPPSGPAARVDPYYPGVSSTGSSAVLPTNTWTHVACTFGGGSLKVYVDGVQVAETTGINSIVPSTNPLRFGQNTYFGMYYKGLIDEVRIYSTTLTAAQIQADMNIPALTIHSVGRRDHGENRRHDGLIGRFR
ncbi:LamG domain-containing protein [Nonomuraea aurantiaca]|uniref:LamG domain-containing protein n=1 Tax=Nonomuraea aurantiaca TaxID=2878562 RepID=UPI001CD94A37|nr:LamG domain-containing protein [Nonomuraea aurantiaca]MCA2228990.1 LamG domain-containing protein [Nonomuraea aurantiaca]